MRADWHYFKNGKEHGPVTFEDLQRLAATGELKESDEVWRQGSAADWTAAQKIPDLFAKPVPVQSLLGDLLIQPVPSVSSANIENTEDDKHPSPSNFVPGHPKPTNYFYRLHRDGSVKEAAFSLSLEELKQYVAIGTLTPTDKLQEERSHEWIQASTMLPEVFSTAKTADITPLSSGEVASPLPASTMLPEPLSDEKEAGVAASVEVASPLPGPSIQPDKWYYRIHESGAIEGSPYPVTLEELKTLVFSGKLKQTDELQTDGTQTWVPARWILPDLFPTDTHNRASMQGEPARISSDKSGPNPTQDVHKSPALKPCSDCGHMVSLRATTCPNCGAPQESQAPCPDCGQAFAYTAQSCPHCGAPREAQQASSLPNQAYTSSGSEWHKMLMGIGALMLVGGFIGVPWSIFGLSRVDQQNAIIVSIGVVVLGGILLLFGRLSAGQRQADSLPPRHKSVKEAYLSKGGMGLIDLIPGIRQAPNSVKWVLAIVGVIGAMAAFYFITSSGNGVAPQSKKHEPLRISQATYQRIQHGMSYREVVNIIGWEGEEMSNVRFEGIPGVMPGIDTRGYSWRNDDGSNMNAMFQNDGLITKAQFGLK